MSKEKSHKNTPNNNYVKKDGKKILLHIASNGDERKTYKKIESKNETYNNLDMEVKKIKKEYKEDYFKEKEIEIRINEFYISNDISSNELFKRKKRLIKKIKAYEIVLLPFIMSILLTVVTYFNVPELSRNIYKHYVVTFKESILKADNEMTEIIERNKNNESIHTKQVEMYSDAIKEANSTLRILTYLTIVIIILMPVAIFFSFLLIYQICKSICGLIVNESQVVDFEVSLIEKRLDLPINK